MRNIAFKYKTTDFWIVVVFIAAVILHSVQFFGRSSMWFDELTSSLNIRDKTFLQLATESLDYNQVAPPGFLGLQKISASIIGVNDLAFRLFPFLFSLLSLYLFSLINRQFLYGLARVCSFILFSFSMSLLFYGGEAKQYSGDITASLFFVWSALWLIKKSPDAFLYHLIAFAGFLFILCSFPAIVIAPSALMIVLIQSILKEKRYPGKWFTYVTTAWMIACLLLAYYSKFVISINTQEAMEAYWSRGFIPLSSPFEFLGWIPVHIYKEFSFFLAWFMVYSFPQISYIALILVILTIPGIIFLLRQNKSGPVILFLPLFVALLLSLFRLLPFEGRVSIYATWPFVIAGFAGIAGLQQRITATRLFIVIKTSMLLIALPIALIIVLFPPARPPYNGQSAEPVLRKLKSQWQEGDYLLVYFKSRHALNFYGPSIRIKDYHVGGSYENIEPFLRQIDSLKGKKRIWFFFSQWTERQPFPDSIRLYMGTVIGKEIGKIADPDGNTEDAEAAAHLYDLSRKIA